MIEPVGCRSLRPHPPQVGFDLGWFMGMFLWLLPQMCFSHYCLSDPALTKHAVSMLMFSLPFCWAEIHSRKELGVWKPAPKTVTQR